MDETTLELLSRAVDEDLDQEEASRLERRLEREPALAEGLASLRASRDAVGRLADVMEPPPDLDRMLVPLRRSQPPEGVLPRRWLAVAAAVVGIGLAVAYQLGREHARPAPSLQALRDAAATPVPERPEYFQLRPLPTSSIPESERPLGARERLLATPDRMPDTGPGEPLVVVGPLPWASPPAGRLTVATGRTVLVAAVPHDAACGSSPVEVEFTVRAGLVATAAVVGDSLSDEDAAACATALVGATVDGFADGAYHGQLQLDPSPHAGDG